MPISQSRILSVLANASGIIPTAFGVNCLFRPEHALGFFYFQNLRTPGDEQLVRYLMIVYGARDIFMGAAIWVALYFGARKAAGGILVAISAVAVADGTACKMNGFGEWDHWGYAPMVCGLGLVAMGVFD